MSNHLILVKKEKPSVTSITLNRPEKRNALNIPLLKELIETLHHLKNDSTVRVLLLQGAGPVFCAGLDLSEAADPTKSGESAELLCKLYSCLYHLPKITIASVQGAALAGGAGLMCACDIAIAANTTHFGFPETQKGLVAAQIFTLLHRQIRGRDIRELLLLGDLITAEKALAIGLINQLVPSNQLKKETLSIANKALLGAPHAISMTKEIIESLSPGCFNDDIRKAVYAHEHARNSKEAEEGIAAFLEKRSPAWVEK